MDVWFKDIGAKRYLIHNGFAREFDFMGNEIRSELPLLPNIVNGAVKVNVVSVLKSGVSSLEVGINESGVFRRFQASKSFTELLPLLTGCGSYVGLLKRTGALGDLGFVQVIFVYPQIVSLLEIVKKVGVVLTEELD